MARTGCIRWAFLGASLVWVFGVFALWSLSRLEQLLPMEGPSAAPWVISICVLGISGVLVALMLGPGRSERETFAHACFRLSCVGIPFALVAMACGYAVPSVPVASFYLGYGLFWLLIPFAVGVRGGRLGFGSAVLGLAAFWFLGTGLALPVPEITKRHSVKKPELVEEDDRIEDKSPPAISAYSHFRENRFGEILCLNKSASVVGIDLAEATSKEQRVGKEIFANFKEASCASVRMDCPFLSSVDLVDGYGKAFDDELLAFLERGVHDGSSLFPKGKQGFLAKLLGQVMKLPADPARDEACAYLAAAILLGGGEPEGDSAVLERARESVKSFQSDPYESKPIGFYTSDETLKCIFQRDRFLQRPFGSKKWPQLLLMARMAEALLEDATLFDAYKAFLHLSWLVCNPAANLSLEDLFPLKDLFHDEERLLLAVRSSEAFQTIITRGNLNPKTQGVAFWPFSYSKETRLMARLYQTFELPPTETMTDLILAIREGRLDLSPTQDSGWYDYQLYALETLLLPERAYEADKLLLHQKYKKRLRQAFQSMITKRRETHVKQLFRANTAGCHIERMPRGPELSVEPCGTQYLRTARAYRFLLRSLDSLFEEGELDGLLLNGSSRGLRSDLLGTIRLYYGLYLTVCDDLGAVPSLNEGELLFLTGMPQTKSREEAEAVRPVLQTPRLSLEDHFVWRQALGDARQWLKDIEDEPFMDQDVRVIVPVLSNYKGTRVRYWAVLGVRLLKIRTYFAKLPEARSLGHVREEDLSSFDPEVVIKEEGSLRDSYWGPVEYVLPVQVFAEVTLGPEPLSREEFRATCDRYKTKDKILAGLSSFPRQE